MKKLVFLLSVTACMAGVSMARLGERRTYIRQSPNFGFTEARDPNNWWDDVNDVYTINGLLDVNDVNVSGDFDVNNVTVTGDLTLEALTVSRLLYLDADSNMASVTDFTAWIAGVANETDVADDGDGTVTIGIIDPLIVGKGGTGAASFSDSHVIYMNSTVLAGDASFTWDDGAAKALTIAGASIVGLNSAVFQPTTDATDFFKIMDADGGQAILTIDSTNEVASLDTAIDAGITWNNKRTTADTASYQYGTDCWITRSAASAEETVGFRSAAISTHSSGTMANLYGYRSVVESQSDSDVTFEYGVAGQSGVKEGNTPAITVLTGVNGFTYANTGVVANSFSFWGSAATKSTGSIGNAITFYGEEQTVGTTQNLSGLFLGDSLIASDKKLIFEGALGTTGDTYLMYDSAGTTLDCFVNSTEVWNASATAFTSVIGRIINRTSVTSSPYTVLATDEHISVTTASVAITLNLPAIIDGVLYHVKDQDGNAAGKNITVTPNGAETVENAATLVINTNGASVTLVANSTTSNWEIQ